MPIKWAHIILTCLLLSSCDKEIKTISPPALGIMESPEGFPEVVHPEGNEFNLNRWELGKKLFYDPILSRDGKISCASCHAATYAFSDTKSVSTGSGESLGTRNAPSLANVAFHPYYTREGGIPTLEMQILVPIQEHNEFNNNIVLIADTLAKIETYVTMSNLAYDQDPNPFVITRALSQFERSLISGQSPYDFEFNYDIGGYMTESALRGLALFESNETSCSTCHSGFNFTNYAFENNGLYQQYEDNGRERLTQNPNDKALFKVPSLRNVGLTAPYMHDGRMESLMDVVEHYNSGGNGHTNQSKLIKPLNLTDQDKSDLVAFLHSLTDEYFVSNKNFSNE